MKARYPALILCALVLLLPFASVRAGNFTVLRSFGVLTNVTGFNPYAPLTQGPDGTLYGITLQGEGDVTSTVFRVNTNGTGFEGLHYFIQSTQVLPYGGLTLASGTLYGTTSEGGASNQGNIFAVTTNGSYTDIYDLGTSTNDGSEPYSAPLISGGFIYGTTLGGGRGYEGTVFKMSTNGTGMTNLVNFNYTNGGSPRGGLVLSGSTLYGVTSEGGSNENGTIYKVNTDGSGFTTMHNFGSLTNDGGSPSATMLLIGSTLYGTAGGGSNHAGTLFSINTAGTGFTNFFSFATANYDTNNFITNSTGLSPQCTLTFAGNLLYGTTYEGGTNGRGTIFQATTNGSEFSVIYTFQNIGSVGGGVSFYGSNFYGAAFLGGTNNYGALFSIETNGSSCSNIFTFAGSDAGYPAGPLVLSNGTLFGSGGGGIKGAGAVFRLATNGTSYTNLYSFDPGISDGPNGNIVLVGNTLYGSTQVGISANLGVVFRVNTDGSGFTNFFSSPAGSLLAGGLIYLNGTLFGQSSDAGGDGTIFTVTTNAVDNANFFDFNGTGYNYPDPVLLASGNVFYGAVEAGGTNGSGAIFSISTNGTVFTVIHAFSELNFETQTNSDGEQPSAAVIQYSNTLFGTTEYGGFYGYGTIFRVDVNGSNFMNLHNFTGGSDGGYSASALVLSGNTLYGTASDGGTGGSGGNGTVFSLATNGAGFTVAHAFTGSSDGAGPYGGLILSGTTLYGTAVRGGNLNEGVVFSLIPEPVLTGQLSGNKLILTWSDATYSLQSSTTADGTYTTIGAATSPYTNTISVAHEYFRLISN